MNKLFTVFKYELKNGLKSKSFIFTTLFLMVGIIGFSIFFRIMATSDNTPDLSNPDALIEDLMGSGEVQNVGYILENSQIDNKDLENLFPLYNMTENSNVDELENMIQNEQYDFGIVIEEGNNINFIYDIAPTMPVENTILKETFRNYLIEQDLQNRGISLAEVREVESSIEVTSSVTSLRGNNTATVPIAMAISVILYMLIIMNGQIAAMNVAREKSDRTMELLITSTKPSNLINGKVFSSFALSMVTLVAIATAFVIAYFINQSALDQILSNIDFNIDPMIIIISIGFFIFGYIMYLYVYAALGATVSTTEELSTALGPVMIIVVVVYFLTIAALSNPNPDNVLLKILSFVPFSSLFTMHSRYAMASVSNTEVAVSFGILVITCIILSIISVRLYRSSSLNYGNENKLFNRLKKKFQKS